MVFSDINEGKKVSDIDARDVYNAYDDIIGVIEKATGCKTKDRYTDDLSDFELDTLKDIVDSFVPKKIDLYKLEDDRVSYVRFEGEMRYLDGVEHDYNGDGDDRMYVYMDENGNIERIEFLTKVSNNRLLNSEYYLTY